VFGYFIEVTRANMERVPADFERKQTLANAERYVTPELKALEAKILDAEDRILALEARLFGDVRRARRRRRGCRRRPERVALLDVLAGLAQLAERRGLRASGRAHRLPARDPRRPAPRGRDDDAARGVHPERHRARRRRAHRDPDRPEHGRQEHAAAPGRADPAARAGWRVRAGGLGRLPVCDRIFTRVGASDNLVRGQSTFMVEMHETAAILHGATARSLVLLDEIGRGTATYDGVSIAWAVTEQLHEGPRAKTIFATHYHELTQLAELLPAVVNCNVAATEVGDDIVFLHRVQPGGADRSYGIQVARLAGVPARGRGAGARDPARARGRPGRRRAGGHRARPRGYVHADERRATDQLSLFAAPSPAEARLRALDIER
jgi:DNA mismatch repair protein MutS